MDGIFSIDVSLAGGTADSTRFYYGASTGRFYADADCEQEITWLRDLPFLEGKSFDGCWSAETGGTKCVSRNGEFLEAFYSIGISSNTTIYARWKPSYIVDVDLAGGTGGTTRFYYGISDGRFYADSECTSEINALPSNPVLEGYLFDGCWTADGVKCVSRNGPLLEAFYGVEISENVVIYARWKIDLEFLVAVDVDLAGGSGGTTRFYYGPYSGLFYADAYGEQEINSLPSIPSLSGHVFDGCWSAETGGTKCVSRNGPFLDPFYSIGISSNTTIYARWKTDPERVTDFFGLETDDGPLMIVSSESGASRNAVSTAGTNNRGLNGNLAIQAADSSIGGFELGPVLMNPTCTYRIRSNGSVVIKLGKAFGVATVKTGKVVKSGFMLVSAVLDTSADGEPTLKVTGAANEGYDGPAKRPYLTDAINRWDVTLSVSPYHVAQDPLGAVSGGGELTECKTLVTCDPVVQMEHGAPCASDVVRGKVVVTATTNAYSGEDAPTAQTPFVEVNGTPMAESDVDFTTYSIKAERSL